MKNKLAILLCLVLCLSLCACGRLDRLKEVELPPLPTVTNSARTVMVKKSS